MIWICMSEAGDGVGSTILSVRSISSTMERLPSLGQILVVSGHVCAITSTPPPPPHGASSSSSGLTAVSELSDDGGCEVRREHK